MKTNAALDQLALEIKNLKIEYEKYFNGALDLPPGELQLQIQREIRELRNSVHGPVANFRLSTLEAQFNSYTELFNRRLRDHEEGKVARRAADGRPDPQQVVMVGEKADDAAVAALYQGLYSGSAEARPVDLESFRSYLDRQATMIRKQTGCAQVQFRLANEGGKLKLKAKPVKGS